MPESISPDEQKEYFEFLLGLDKLSDKLDGMGENFPQHAAQLSEEPDTNTLIRGMMNFAVEYHQDGLFPAVCGALKRNSLIPMQIALPDMEFVDHEVRVGIWPESKRKEKGIIIGLIGARRMNDVGRVFDGVAILTDRSDGNGFIAVGITSNGAAFVHPKYLLANHPIKIEDLFPPQRPRIPERN